jgi:hypothetical protein
MTAALLKLILELERWVEAYCKLAVVKSDPQCTNCLEEFTVETRANQILKFNLKL